MSATSPFKFLDAYTKNDKDIFFGRDEEIENLYNLVFQSNLTLVYGQSGTGKTSLVQCGLANRFAQSDWFNIYLRRNEDINKSLLRTLKRFEEVSTRRGTLLERLQKKRSSSSRSGQGVAETDEPVSEVVSALRSMSKHYLKPIFLIFDQFEELFILGSKEEQDTFYETIADILEHEAYCRVIFIMREESIAQLSDFEKVVPFLFDKRLRVEPMSRAKTEEVITQTCAKFDIGLENDQVPQQIIEILGEGKSRVELTYLQVFLDQLYQEAAQNNPGKVVFGSQLIRKVGNIEDVLGDFLARQTRHIQAKFAAKYPHLPQSSVQKVLSAFVTLEGTKRPMAREEVKVANLHAEQVGFVIDELEKGRILRFDNNLFELAHDTLALRIANERSADEVALLQIAKIVRDRYQVSATTKALLNANELQLINNLRSRIQEEGLLSADEWDFVKKSAKANTRRLVFIASVIILLLATLTGFSLYSSNLAIKAKKAEAEAVYSLTRLQEAQEQEKRSKYDAYTSEGKAKMAQSDYLGAIQSFETALEWYKGAEALDSLQVAKNKSGASMRFQQLIDDGDALLNQGPASYTAALVKFQDALSLNYKNSLAESRINIVRGKIEPAFEEYKEYGDTFYEAKEYGEALKMYRIAQSLKSYDSHVSQRIRECQDKLK